ncbi:transglycosylase SLT domain-containing protein [Undibacterium sp. Jales W-56]|uniref:transglycosylase SLT domain-containing protein n=1 Tax=Undibacterium sp. Jales W-56 TaxID=2897325 RepID=UPI0021CE46DD|nr:transglycosylase SLT domain-containing protein [Undibacterium sp. Jales W-56]MCU6433942.1 transglycosylase SLT domain-containing protein [Undibacterium sp. Jales W-56]
MKPNRQLISSLFSPAISSVLIPTLVFCLSSAAYAEERDAATSANTPESNISLIQTAPAASTVAVELPLDTTVQETDLWNRIRSGYAIPDLDNQLVNNQLTWYSTRTDYIQRTVQRGSRYLFHVVEELEKRGMPTELALLPFIESAFNPQAISTAKASGMWQFMAATGRDFNLKQNMFKDDRRGVLDSTDAALTYLERLYGIFGDWQLALAAYNWGEGSVQRAIKKQQAMGLPIDFESLSALMPNETKNYLPKLQAVKNIIGHPEQFGIELPKLDNQPYFVSVEKTRDIDVRVAAQLAEMSVGDFTALNPQFNRPVITGNSATKILLPTDNAVVFKDNLSKWSGPLSSWATHTVGKTERIESLANRLGLKPEVLREVNLIPAKMLVKAGSTLLVPKSSKTPDQDISLEIAEKAQLIIEKMPSTRQVNIKVGKRDNLNSIARHYRVSVADLKGWNNLKRDSVTTGQALQIHLPIQQARSRGARITVAHNNSHGGKTVHHPIKTHTIHTGKMLLAKAKSGKKHS